MKTEYVCTFLMVVLFITVPWFTGVLTPFGTMACILAGCVLLSLIAGLFGKTKGRIFVPITIGIAFLFTVPFFYNESAMIWGLWLGIVSAVCVAIGWGISALMARGQAKRAERPQKPSSSGSAPVRPEGR